jgi:phosphate:Na+ symporter
MGIDNILGLCSGLALFLYGMHMMSEGLELAAGNKMQHILEKLTSNRFIGVLVGALVTALIQSSSATTVMVVGFVNTGLMSLSQVVWIIMGANIGTTITGQLIALDVGRLAPIMALLGVIMIVFIKNKKINCWGEILAGLGVLFVGMNLMSTAMTPLRNDPTFIDLMTNFNNPIIAILVGAAFTAIIQSSSASVGILQTIANNGLLGLGQSAYILFGQNIGTCITAFLASLGGNRNAKRTTIIHLSFNILGTIIFIVACNMLPIVSWVESFSGKMPATQIANFHTLFNVVTTLLLLPFGNYLAKLSTIILPINDKEKTNDKVTAFLLPYVGSTFAGITNLKLESQRMLTMVGENINSSLQLLSKYDSDVYTQMKEKEEYIDYLSNEITNYVSQISSENMQTEDSDLIQALFTITIKLERVGNHAMNVAYAINDLHQKKKSFVYEKVELKEIEKLLITSIAYLEKTVSSVDDKKEEQSYIIEAEETLDILTKKYRNNEMKRLQNKECDLDNCVTYARVLVDIERISDYFKEIVEIREEHHVLPVSVPIA